MSAIYPFLRYPRYTQRQALVTLTLHNSGLDSGLGTTVPQLAYRSIGRFLHPQESHIRFTHNQNHKSPSSKTLSHFYRGDADVSASVELA